MDVLLGKATDLACVFRTAFGFSTMLAMAKEEIASGVGKGFECWRLERR